MEVIIEGESFKNMIEKINKLYSKDIEKLDDRLMKYYNDMELSNICKFQDLEINKCLDIFKKYENI